MTSNAPGAPVAVLIGAREGLFGPMRFWRGSSRLGWTQLEDDGREMIGGARRDRTADLLHAMQALSRLSYGPVKRELEV